MEELVTIDLNPLPFTIALEILRYCILNDIDRDNCLQLLKSSENHTMRLTKWEITVPEKYITYFNLMLS